MAPKAGRKPPGERPPQNSVKPLFISAAQRAAATMVLYGFAYGTAVLTALHVVSPGACSYCGSLCVRAHTIVAGSGCQVICSIQFGSVRFYFVLKRNLKLTVLGGSTTFVAFALAACIFP
eukprot:768110-Amphidinium_carterae.1